MIWILAPGNLVRNWDGVQIHPSPCRGEVLGQLVYLQQHKVRLGGQRSKNSACLSRVNMLKYLFVFIYICISIVYVFVDTYVYICVCIYPPYISVWIPMWHTHNTNKRFFNIIKTRKWDHTKPIIMQPLFSFSVSWLSLVKVEKIQAMKRKWIICH